MEQAAELIGVAIVLFAASVLASLADLVIPEIHIGLLGLIPIGIGLFQLRDFWSDGGVLVIQEARSWELLQ